MADPTEPTSATSDESHVPEVGTKSIRYVFTLVMPKTSMPDDAVAQRAWVADVMAKITEHVKPERVGVTAVTEE